MNYHCLPVFEVSGLEGSSFDINQFLFLPTSVILSLSIRYLPIPSYPTEYSQVLQQLRLYVTINKLSYDVYKGALKKLYDLFWASFVT